MMNWMSHSTNFLRDESGQDLIEYALIAAVVGVGSLTAMKSLATAIGNVFVTVTNSLNSGV